MTETTTLYWCQLAWLGGDTAALGATLSVTGDRITAVQSGVVEPPPGAVRLDGLTLPALANAHSHAFHRVLRGRTHSGRGSFWSWRRLMYQVASKLDPDSYYELARAVYGEMVLAGIGVVGEFHYVHHQYDATPYDDPNAMGLALVAAAQDAGIRLTLLDTLYLHGGFGPGGSVEHYAPTQPEQGRFCDGSAQQWGQRVDALAATAPSPSVVVGSAIHSVRAVDPASVALVRQWADDHAAPLHIHVSEQPAENEQCADHFGRTPIALLGEHGGLGPETTLIHATHINSDDIARTARSGATCCFCPTTERDLADGIGPSRALSDAGVALALGSDSHAVVDLFEEARALDLNQRLGRLERGVHPPVDLATAATAAGYRSLGWPNGGTLVAGGLADFTTVTLDSVRLAGTSAPHALASVLFAASAADVYHVVVAGRPVVEGGRHRRLDVATALAASIENVVGR